MPPSLPLAPTPLAGVEPRFLLARTILSASGWRTGLGPAGWVLVTNLGSTPASGVGAKRFFHADLVTNLGSTPASGVGAKRFHHAHLVTNPGSTPTSGVGASGRYGGVSGRPSAPAALHTAASLPSLAPAPLAGVEPGFVSRRRWPRASAPTPLAGVEPRFVTRHAAVPPAGPHPACRGGAQVPAREHDSLGERGEAGLGPAGWVLVTNLGSTPASGVGAKRFFHADLVTNLGSTPASGVGASIRRRQRVWLRTWAPPRQAGWGPSDLATLIWLRTWAPPRQAGWGPSDFTTPIWLRTLGSTPASGVGASCFSLTVWLRTSAPPRQTGWGQCSHPPITYRSSPPPDDTPQTCRHTPHAETPPSSHAHRRDY